MTNREIYELFIVLGRNQQMRYSKTAYAAFRSFSAISEQGRTIDRLRGALLEEYGNKGENNTYTIPPEKVTEYLEKEKELMGADAEVKVYKVSQKDFDAESERLITEDGVTIGDCAVIERYLVDDDTGSTGER